MRLVFKDEPRSRTALFLLGSFILLAGSFSSLTAFGRDLHGRFGLGYSSQFAQDPHTGSRVPAVSIKYGLTKEFSAEAIAGFSTAASLQNVLALKVFKNFFFENYLNFYGMGGAGLIRSKETGVQILAGLGVEFFVPGIESLGLSVETGISFDNASGGYGLRTLGMSFLDAGIHFYF